MNATRSCSENDCVSPVKGRGLCNMHYKRARVASGATKADARPCTIAECEQLAFARKLCMAHYRRWRQYGDPLGAPKHDLPRTCSYDSCERKHSGLGYCKMHYKRLVNNGDPNIVQIKNAALFPVVDGMKVCLRCNGNKPLASFYVSGQKIQPRCKDCALEQARKRYEKDRLKFIARSWNSRYREAGAGVSLEQLRQRFSAYGWACWMCGSTSDICVDHVKPRGKGGPHIPANVRPACASCNGRKHDHWFGAVRVNEFKV